MDDLVCEIGAGRHICGDVAGRIRAVLWRAAQTATMSRPSLTVDDPEIDFTGRRTTVRGREARLTPTEYDLLVHLSINAGRVLTHRTLLQAVWGPECGDEPEYL